MVNPEETGGELRHFDVQVPTDQVPVLKALGVMGARVEEVGVAPASAESGEDQPTPAIGYDQFYSAVQQLKPGFDDTKIRSLATRAQVGLFTAASQPEAAYALLVSAVIGFRPGERDKASELEVDARGLLQYTQEVRRLAGERPSVHALAQVIDRQNLMPRNTGPAILEIWEHAAKTALAAENQQ